MKNIFLLAILIFALLTATRAEASILQTVFKQDLVILQITCTQDTASSFFGQDFIWAKYVIPETDSVVTSPKHNTLEVKLANHPWTRIGNEFKPVMNTRVESTTSKVLISFLELFNQASDLDTLIMKGELYCQVRLHLSAAVNDQPGSFDFYSNVDTMYLPAPTPNDWAALQYLRNSGIDANSFSWLWGYEDEYEDYYKVLRDSFPNAVISDAARFIQLRKEHDLVNFDKLNPTPSAKILVKEQYLMLKNSKSPYIRECAEFFYPKYIKD